MARVEDEMKELEEKAKATAEALEKEQKLRKELETQNVKLLQEKNELFNQLEQERGGSGDLEEKLQRIITQKADLDSQLQVSTFSSIWKKGEKTQNILSNFVRVEAERNEREIFHSNYQTE